METQKLTLDGVSDLPQKETLKHIMARLRADLDPAALWLVGSFAGCAADKHSDSDLLALIGLGLEQSVLRRLWYMDATGSDQGTQRPTIHSLKTLGSTRTNRAEIRQAIEAYRNEAAAVGRRLAGHLGFAYPDALEQIVRRCWQEYLANNAKHTTPA